MGCVDVAREAVCKLWDVLMFSQEAVCKLCDVLMLHRRLYVNYVTW